MVITFTSGIMSTGVSNHLISELKYEPWIGGFIVSMAPAGFMIFTLAFGHISDKYGQRKVIYFIMVLRLIFSIFYLIPITSDVYLITFGIIFFFDGAISGLFWPTVQQISVLTEQYGGLDLKQKFMSGYNFSWNWGFISGMLTGAIIVFLFNSNYATFYFNSIGLIFGVTFALLFVKDVSNLFKFDYNKNLTSNEFAKANSNPEYLEYHENQLNLKLFNIPLYSILLILVIHSLTDGVITIFLTIKIDNLNQGLYWVFILTLIKLCSQMIATTIFSLTKERIIIKGLILAVLTVLITWSLFIFSNDLWTISLLFLMTGIGQGAIYAFVMKLIAYKAGIQKSARPFAFFQTIMSSGRMVGALLFGFTATISFNLGIFILIIYDLFSLIQFFCIIKILLHEKS